MVWDLITNSKKMNNLPLFRDRLFKSKAGDIEAIEEIFKNFEKILSYHEKKYFILGGNKEDIFQEASIGLIQVIGSYDKNKNRSFENFAFLCIERQIIWAIRNSNCGKNKFLNTASSNNGLDKFTYEKRAIKFYNPEEILLSKEKIRELNIYLKDKLSKNEKEIFNSRFFLLRNSKETKKKYKIYR